MPIAKADGLIKAGDLAPVTIQKFSEGGTIPAETVYAKLDPNVFGGLPAQIDAGSMIRLEWFGDQWHIVSCEVP